MALAAVPPGESPAQLYLFEDQPVLYLKTTFSGTLNDIDDNADQLPYGQRVTLVVEGRVRRVNHVLDKDERTVRQQSVLIDRIVEVR